MTSAPPPRLLATLTPSPVRRGFAVAGLSGSGALLLWVALEAVAPGPALRLALMVSGGALIWAAGAIWRATRHRIELTEAGLFDAGGRAICAMDDIRDVERGVFAFKPSGGFVVRLRRAPGRGWAPGLWWRFGRQVGIGGVTPAAQGKVMADILALHLSRRDSGS